MLDWHRKHLPAMVQELQPAAQSNLVTKRAKFTRLKTCFAYQ
jgi:hypothetical protein